MSDFWAGVKHFSATGDHWSEDPEKYAQVGLIRTLDRYRDQLGHPVYPSPAPGALARFSGSKTSRHYAIDRWSDAIDVFCGCNIRQAWMTALRMMEWGGIGVYFDTEYNGRPHRMLHLDMRPVIDKVIWFRNASGYHYPAKDPAGLVALFDQLLVGGE